MRNVLWNILLISLYDFSGASAHHQASVQPTVNIKNGKLVGTRNWHYGQDFFLGIPYARPPIGKLRLHRPQALNETWMERSAVAYGPWCYSIPQSFPGFSVTGFIHDESEDCLSLNVVRPSGIEPGAKLPVLVWIYGGGFQEGGSADQRYNTSFIVQESVRMNKPIIAVSFNYRLSGFGFLPGTAVNASRVANLGLHDQRLALRWVQDNIAAFGGDPSHVTLQGESAGAFSIGLHYLANGGRDEGLFHAAIAQSGGSLLATPLISLEEQDKAYTQILADMDCLSESDGLECLRSKDANELNAAFAGHSYTPIMDDDFVTGYTSVSIKEGRFLNKPLLIGTCFNEATSIVAVSGFAVNTTAHFRTWVTRSWPGVSEETVDAFVDEYISGLSSDEVHENLGTVQQSPSPALGLLYGNTAMYQGEIMFDARRRYVTKMWAAYGVPVYSYRFNVVPNGIDPITLGVPHFQEIPFVFRNLDGVGFDINRLSSNSSGVHLDYMQVSNLMSRMWISFVHGYTPNGHDLADFGKNWSVYSTDHPVNMLFGLQETELEADTWRMSAIDRIIESFPDLRV